MYPARPSNINVNKVAKIVYSALYKNRIESLTIVVVSGVFYWGYYRNVYHPPLPHTGNPNLCLKPSTTSLDPSLLGNRIYFGSSIETKALQTCFVTTHTVDLDTPKR